MHSSIGTFEILSTIFYLFYLFHNLIIKPEFYIVNFVFYFSRVNSKLTFFLNHTKNAHIHGTHHEHKRFILSQYVFLHTLTQSRVISFSEATPHIAIVSFSSLPILLT